jgi:hypothetical protein
VVDVNPDCFNVIPGRDGNMMRMISDEVAMVE